MAYSQPETAVVCIHQRPAVQVYNHYQHCEEIVYLPSNSVQLLLEAAYKSVQLPNRHRQFLVSMHLCKSVVLLAMQGLLGAGRVH